MCQRLPVRGVCSETYRGCTVCQNRVIQGETIGRMVFGMYCCAVSSEDHTVGRKRPIDDCTVDRRRPQAVWWRWEQIADCTGKLGNYIGSSGDRMVGKLR